MKIRIFCKIDITVWCNYLWKWTSEILKDFEKFYTLCGMIRLPNSIIRFTKIYNGGHNYGNIKNWKSSLDLNLLTGE